MTLSADLTLFICLTLGAVGTLFIVAPKTTKWLEQRLNQTLSQKEVLAIRLGTPGEQRIEEILNRNVLGTRITWDSWIHQRPRLIGFLLCAIAALLWWL